ncbi:tumor necrosis factor receptor superfamily member 5-like isoform X2 [Carcharodon carcharias]|uniref:tumor necrosis factor receptor superfamily member 5-like isoform X2 n=1 Tax=Carcharodon carcharias TaxID=13397 RepID=UPI001B7E0F79|nr:tumor necrosis factor receptor superfamily member 5-like isoform X2 [Carcharodon carcharias]
MDSLSFILLSCVIPLYLCDNPSNCDNETQYFKADKCCFKCGPGSFMKAECETSVYSSCDPCLSGFYQPVWTKEDHCRKHSACDSTGDFEVMKAGDQLKDIECLCKHGMHCPNKDCEVCEHDKMCPPGQGVKSPGDRKYQATICEDCELGFYSNVTSLTESCRKWLDCAPLGLRKVKLGTSQSDVECGYLDQAWNLLQRQINRRRAPKEKHPERVAQETQLVGTPEMEQGGSNSLHTGVQEEGKESHPSEEEGQNQHGITRVSYITEQCVNGLQEGNA